MKNLIKINKKLWLHFKAQVGAQKLLIEESFVPYITHVNAVFSIILNQAKLYTPVWLQSRSLNMALLKSYLPITEYIQLAELSLIDKSILIMKTIRYYIEIYKTRDILSFSYDKIKYGDIVYDTYLMQEKVATIANINLKILFIIYACILRHERIKKTLKSDNFEGVLVSHQIDISSGVMLRVALRYGYKGYLRAGHHQSTLQCFKESGEVYNYEYKPFSEDIDNIIAALGSKLDKSFSLIMNKQVSGKGDADGKYAYAPQNKFYKSRKAFCKHYKLNPKKRNIFIMLHALNDYPHVHFRQMIFKDFYEWLMETLAFAEKFPKVNWIFKQHPSIKFYPTKDISFEKIFKNLPKNVIYINEENQIDTRSLIYCTDVVITCLGSIGFELPAMVQIPSIVASETFYSGLGFTLDPRNKKEYFEILRNIDKITRLTKKQQDIAKAAYIHIYELSRVNMSSCPVLSLEDQNDINLYNDYWQKVEELYKIRGKQIIGEVRGYIKEVAKKDFKQLNSLKEFMKKIEGKS